MSIENESQVIAIVGVSGRFPKANNIDEFWDNLVEGKECLSQFSDEELIASGESKSNLNKNNYVRSRGVVANVADFDADFFSMSPLEAKILDPQQRIFLECAWECFEDAGIVSDKVTDRIGVFAACGLSHYLINNLLQNRKFFRDVDSYQILLGNDKDFIATRTAYKLKLKGPAITISCGCSSSLVAVHYACQSLLNGECEMALAGGVSISIPQARGYLYKKEMIGSPDGHSYPFDYRAKGTVKSNGAGIVLLKLLDAAIADRDQIYAVIRGSAVNNDGNLKVGYTAPSVEQQAAVIAEALAVSGVDASTIQYVEAHGTSTQLGDPIEFRALCEAFKRYNVKPQNCALASLKSNIGHLDAAAGVSSLIKICLAMKKSVMPPSINYDSPNPNIQFNSSPFYVLTEPRAWPKSAFPKRAGVSSFGIGGTNTHLILESYNHGGKKRVYSDVELILLSAKSKKSLLKYKDKLLNYLVSENCPALIDVAYTLGIGRKHFQFRSYYVASSKNELIQLLSSNDNVNSNSSKNIVLMFSGQGSQYADMGLNLYKKNLLFKQKLDFCLNYLKQKIGLELKPILFSLLSGSDNSLVNQTQYTQISLFVVEYALACLLLSFGVQPVALIGHSIGEYVAAVISGVISIENALKIVVKRGQLVQKIPQGKMLAVFASADSVRLITHLDKVSLALINSPMTCVLSGESEIIDKIRLDLQEKNIQSHILRTSHAFHSHMLDPVLFEFDQFLKKIHFHPPKIPVISNVTGKWLTPEQAKCKKYWVRQLREPVLFSDGIKLLLKKLNPVFVEVGPGSSLTTLTKQHGIENVVCTMPFANQKTSELSIFYKAVGYLWQIGALKDTNKFFQGRLGERISLPTYAWQRQRYWIEPIEDVECIKLLKENTYESDGGSLVSVLLSAWNHSLGVDNNDLDANFFQMGGDSLAAVNFIDRLEPSLRENLSVVDVYQYPTVNKLVEFLSSKSNAENDKSFNRVLEAASLELEYYDREEEL